MAAISIPAHTGNLSFLHRSRLVTSKEKALEVYIGSALRLIHLSTVLVGIIDTEEKFP